MRSERAMKSSRREILANVLGTAFVMGLPSRVSAGKSRSRQGQSNTGTSKTRRTTRKISLTWDVFLAPSIPAITSDLPPGEKQRPWPPISSTLISGERDAVLVDTPITVEQAHRGKSDYIGLRRRPQGNHRRHGSYLEAREYEELLPVLTTCGGMDRRLECHF
jgi:hypothetical protein